MPRVSLAFFAFAAACGVIGMGWGIYMGMAHDHSTFAAHAHLNLLGWVTGALMGGFYALVRDRVSGRLPWINLGFTSLGTMLMIPALAAKLKGGDAIWIELGIAIGAFASFFGMVTLFIAVILAAQTKRTRKAAAA